MADLLQQVVDVSISVETQFPSRLGFGTPAVVTYHTRFAENNRTYSSFLEFTEDGFDASDEAYRIVQKLFSQNPSPTQVVVGRLATAPVHTGELTITSAVEGSVVSFKVMQPATGLVSTISYTVAAAETPTTVATAVELLVEAVPGIASSSALAVIALGTDVAGDPVYVFDLQNCTFADTSVLGTYEAELDALRADNDDWYFLLIGSQGALDIADVAEWSEANKKLFFYQRTDSSLVTSVDAAAAALAAAEYTHTAGIYHWNGMERADAAWVGLGAPLDPGSITWSLKTLAGITARNPSSTGLSNLDAANVNHYTTIRGVSVVRQGRVASGEWIDIVHGIDALQDRIAVDVFGLLAASPKVPYTDKGIVMVDNVLKGALSAFTGESALLAPGTVNTFVPARANISTGDVAARQLRDVTFTAKLTGAIHFVQIRGKVSY